MPVLFIFMQDSDPIHTSKHITVLDRPRLKTPVTMENVKLLGNSITICRICELEYGTIGNRFSNNFPKELCPLEATRYMKIEAILINIDKKLKAYIFLLLIKVFYFYSRNINLRYFTVQLKSSV